MKKALLIAFLFLFTGALVAKDQIIVNPYYEFSTTGISHITKIERKKTETRIHVRTTFIPGWWVMFGKGSYIQDSETGTKWQAIRIEGTEFDKETYMPASGDSSFVLVFPPLDKSVKKLDYSDADESEKPIIYGVSLEQNDAEAKGKESVVPDSVKRWIDAALKVTSKTKRASADDFFCRDTARLVGYIKGYDLRAGFSTGLIYLDNEITREGTPTVITIHPDGRFEVVFSLSYPQVLSASFEKGASRFYIAPGETLSMILNWEDFLIADRLRNIYYTFKDVTFGGSLKQINSDLLRYKEARPFVSAKYKEMLNSNTPMEYYSYEKARYEENLSKLLQIAGEYSFSLESVNLLQNSLQVSSAYWLLNFADDRNGLAYHDTTRQDLKVPEPAEFYDFLRNMDLNDPHLLSASDFSGFINRLEYCKPFERARTKGNRFVGGLDDYYLKEWKMKDSVLTHYLGLKPSLICEMIKVRSMAVMFTRNFKADDKQRANLYLTELGRDISTPFLRDELGRLYAEYCYKMTAESYELPAGKPADIFRKLIEPFKGKFLFVDFWATSCGPCIANIKAMKEIRAKYKDNPDFEFVFITPEDLSPLNIYTTFVEEQDLQHTYRISPDDYHYLRQLFRFNGIPRYVLINKQGRVANDDYSMSARWFENDLRTLFSGK